MHVRRSEVVDYSSTDIIYAISKSPETYPSMTGVLALAKLIAIIVHQRISARIVTARQA